jgi:hypothetical protein
MESLPEHPLRTWRLRKKKSLAWLARRLGVYEGTVARWELWQRFPEHKYFPAIYALTKGEITPNSFVNWLPSQSTGPLADSSPAAGRRPRRNPRREAPDAANPEKVAA